MWTLCLFLIDIACIDTKLGSRTIRVFNFEHFLQVVINNQPLQILAAALGGVNVDNCPHPCVTRPCGDEGRCVPEMDYFTCECAQGYRDTQCQQHAAPTMLQDIPIPRFAGDSYLHYSDPDTMRRQVVL